MLMKPIKQPSSKQPNKFQAFANKLGPLVYNGLIKRGYTKRSTYDNVMSQLAFESTYGTSPLALRAHNYGGYGYNGKDYNVYKNDADFIDAYLNDMAGKYKKALNADTVADYAKELKRIGYFEAPLDQYTKNLIGMQSVRKAAAVHYGQPIVQQKPALMAVQLPKSFVPQETAQTIEESSQNAFKQPVLPPVGRGPEPEVEVPYEQTSPFIFQHSIDLPPIEQTIGALLNDQPMVNLPGYKGGKDDESLRYFAKGAKNAGFGLNTTVGGISGFNDNTPTSVAGWIQPKVKGLYDIKNAKEVVDLVKRINGDSQRIMTNDEIDLFNNLTKQRIPHDITVRDVLQRSYSTPDLVKQQLQQFSDQTGINAFQGNVYNRRNKYGGIIRDLNDPEDLVGITESGASNFFGGPSFLERMNIIKSINNSGSRSPLDQVINNISRNRSYNILPEHVQSVRNKLDNQLNTYR